MDLETLRTFDHIVREGSFSRAAWVLNVAQPTVSARIQALEREVGGALFTRGRKVSLTQRGHGFLPHARRALATVQDGLDAARLAGSGERGRLAVGALRSLSGAFLAPAVAQAYRQRPGVECVVREGRHAEIVEYLADGVIELGVICWPPADGHHPDLTPLLHFREPVLPTLHPAHPHAHHEAQPVETLLAEAKPLLLLRWWQFTPPEVQSLAAQAPEVADVPTDTGRHL
ncbi:LysR family transcriptional regulator, partial [Deinococcus sp.]|uniref:LysR family transcriptional regulator n=1 Tax=Deinococcus sp. TaxID=47478 RepID=UPI0028698A83